MKNLSEIYRKGASWIKNIDRLKSLLILYHNDADGLCSAIMLKRIFKELKNKTVKCIPSGNNLSENLTEKIAKEKPDYLVFLDFSADQYPNQLILIKESLLCSILIIDHHPPSTNLAKSGILQINPRFAYKDVYLPTSYLVYKIGENLIDMKDLLWIALVGITGDRGLKNCKDLEFNFNVKDMEHASDFITAAHAFKRIENAFFTLDTSKNLEEFLKNEQLNKWNEEIQSEIEGVVNDFEKNSEFHKNANLAIYFIDSKLAPEADTASIISDKYQKMTVIVCKKDADKINCSLRNQKGGINLSEVIKLSLSGLKNSSGGGHEHAGGATVSMDEWEKFKKNLIKNLERHLLKV